MKCLFADCVIHCLSFSIMKLIRKQKAAVVRLLVLRKKADTCPKNDRTAETSSASSLVQGRAGYASFQRHWESLEIIVLSPKKKKPLCFMSGVSHGDD